jgi:hypothetical protein
MLRNDKCPRLGKFLSNQYLFSKEYFKNWFSIFKFSNRLIVFFSRKNFQKLEMKFFRKFTKIFITFLFCVNCKTVLNFKINRNPAIQALADVIDVLFINRSIVFDFVVVGRMTSEVADVVDGVRNKLSMHSVKMIKFNCTSRTFFHKYSVDEMQIEKPSVVFYDFD